MSNKNTDELISAIEALDAGKKLLLGDGDPDGYWPTELTTDDLKSLLARLSTVERERDRLRDALGLARVRINRLAHVIQRDQPALWNGTQLGPATEDDVREIEAALEPVD